ncbi:hypothetical protein OUZ56_033112 [Daphnia magna]|uniref:Tetratricopeptide repeat protein n=1 Tax=Daphnia magna TaxID=35525 RepID=A0ABR0BA84_9CRUS|nr:hypothetical protein OUZ56_033112 [Daphnia magna]
MSGDDIERLLCAAEECRDESALMAIIDELERRSGEHAAPALLYACAYAWYLHPRRVAEDSIAKRVDELLKCVLVAAPGDYLSLLYLGHNLYDCGKYTEAKLFFASARDVAPKSYIGLKAYEMVVCCDFVMGGFEGNFAGSLQAFVEEASQESYAPEDVWPRELAGVLQRVQPRFPPNERQLAQVFELAERLDGIGSLNGWMGTLVRRLWRVAKVSASNLYDWGFETPAAIVIVDELSRKAAHLLEKRVSSQWFEAVKKANLWSRESLPADERARFRADLYLSDTNILRLKIALRATIAEFTPRWWEVDVIFGLSAVDIGVHDFKEFLKRLEALEIPKARRSRRVRRRPPNSVTEGNGEPVVTLDDASDADQ